MYFVTSSSIEVNLQLLLKVNNILRSLLTQQKIRGDVADKTPKREVAYFSSVKGI